MRTGKYAIAPSGELTEQEREIAALIFEAKRPKTIAHLLHMHHNTVRWHIGRIALKLDIKPEDDTRVQIAKWWWRTHGDPSPAPSLALLSA